MAWAGRRVARWILAMAPHAQRIWVAAGPGGNGGDGLYAAAHLARQGRKVAVTLHPDSHGLSPGTQVALQYALGSGCMLVDGPDEVSADLVIDALLGLGANRPLSLAMAAAVQAIAGQARPCLSIDIPTGLDADTGQALGGGLVRAQATLSLLTLKPGLLMGEGRDAAGQIWLDTLGVQHDVGDAAPVALTTFGPPRAATLERRPHASHKGRFGDVVLVGGATGMYGALRLAADAALAAGAGRVIVVPLDSAAPLWDWTRPECLWMRPQTLADTYPLERATVVCGCGGGEDVVDFLPTLLGRARHLVLDADALNAAAQHAAIRLSLQTRGEHGRHTVLTPHPLEAARLLNRSVQDVQANRLGAAHQLASEHHSTVVLKGSGTVITTSGFLPEINVTGNGALATGGTGDVLAGWLAGRWASGSARGSDEAALAHQSACNAVFIHGLAADHHGAHHAVRALDLIEQMRALVA